MATQNLSISNFKKFSLKIIIPLLLSIIVIGFIFQSVFERGVILNSEINGCYKVNRIIKLTNYYEIPILGSSRAEGGFMPSILGSNYFNYGLSGTQDNVILFFLNEECKKRKQTPIIINFDIDGLNSSIGDISNYIYNSEYKPVENILGENYKYYFQIPFFKYYGHYEFYLKNWLTNRINLTKRTDNGASLELNKLPIKRFNELVNQRDTTIGIFKNDKTLQNAFLDIFNNNVNRRFIFVVSPYHKSWFNSFNNFTAVKTYLHSIDQLTNVSVFDFSHVDYPDSLFMDTSHLNYYGAKRFSNELKDSLRKINIENQ